jgi:3',5'-cyclic AMP phosphodiesterase CpdA
MRIFCVSDLHCDFQENWSLLERLPAGEYAQDALIVAGDVADKIETIQRTLELLRSKFAQVFYTPGNHELWVRGDWRNSLQKLDQLLELCDILDVMTRPAEAAGYWVVPLLSWYDDSLDYDGVADPAQLEAWGDFHFCRWPAGLSQPSQYFLRRNQPLIRPYDKPVISFSHFLPRLDLLPGIDDLRFKGLPRVAGSAELDRQVRALGSCVHVFGHSHINRDRTIDGIRYVQHAMLYPREREWLGSKGIDYWSSAGPLLELVKE